MISLNGWLTELVRHEVDTVERWLHTYWVELLVFGAIFAGLVVCATPDYTWINTDSDGIHYTYAAKYLVPAHKSSAPLFLLLGHVFLGIHLGTEAWRMAMMSVIATTISSMFVYLVIREKVAERGRLYGIIGAIVFGGSALVISQSTIIETYALVTMFGLGAYYYATKGKWITCAIMLGAGGAVHHLIGIPLIVMFIAYKGLRNFKCFGIMSIFTLFYLYIPLTGMINNPPDMWGNIAIGNFIGDVGTTAAMLIGGLSIWDVPKRMLDAGGILVVSLGLALIPIAYFAVKREGIKWYREPLLWLFGLPILYYITDMAPQTYVYMMPAVGFGAIITGIALAKMPRPMKLLPQWNVVILVTAVVLMAVNVQFLDIGRTLDPNMSASAYYYEELGKVPDGDILLPQQGWEWAAIIPYNKQFDREIIPVSLGNLPSPQYQEVLKDNGVDLIGYPEAPISTRSGLIATSIVELNDNVWTSYTTTPETYGAEISLVNGEVPFVTEMDEVNPTWQWTPDNPYGIITGEIEVEEWVWITWSSHNCLMVLMLAVIGGVPCWIVWMMLIKKRKWSIRRNYKVGGKVKCQQ